MSQEMLNQAKHTTQNVPISQSQIMAKMGRMDWAEMALVIQLQEKIQLLEKQLQECQNR